MFRKNERDQDDADLTTFSTLKRNHCLPNARKLNHCRLYAVCAENRFSMGVLIANRLQSRRRETARMTLDTAYQPWWMSFKQYQAMLFRLGLPF